MSFKLFQKFMLPVEYLKYFNDDIPYAYFSRVFYHFLDRARFYSKDLKRTFRLFNKSDSIQRISTIYFIFRLACPNL